MTPEKLLRDARCAAANAADAVEEKLAALYAVETLGSLLDDVLKEFPEFAEVLGSPLISYEEKCNILDRAFGSRVPPMVLGFLKMLSRQGRLSSVAAVRRAAEALLDATQGRVRIELTTSIPLDDASFSRVAQRLSTRLGARTVISRRVDPEIIGGAVIRVGDTVYDYSVAAQLELIRKRVISRNVHEIQSGRNRFNNSAGD
jgi:F-type H+-transporting ATPase subunit delta